MPRQGRFDLLTIPQHAIQRGNDRNACFLDDDDRQRYLSVMLEAAVMHECEIHTYLLMSNHVHL